MSESPKATIKTTEQPGKVTHPAILLGITALDTTLRVFIPVLAGLFGGIALDHKFHTGILWTLVLMVVGAVIAGYLVYRQLKKVKNE